MTLKIHIGVWLKNVEELQLDNQPDLGFGFIAIHVSPSQVWDMSPTAAQQLQGLPVGGLEHVQSCHEPTPSRHALARLSARQLAPGETLVEPLRSGRVFHIPSDPWKEA